jgi:hypothetical protein
MHSRRISRAKISLTPSGRWFGELSSRKFASEGNANKSAWLQLDSPNAMEIIKLVVK